MRLLLAVVFGAGLTLTTRGDEAPKSVSSDVVAELKDRIQPRLERLVATCGVPGVTAAVVLADGKTVALAAGLADRDTQLPMTPRHRMPAGSVGKTFVAAMALGLAHDGKLDLDDPVEKWLSKESWFKDLPNAHEITLRQLLMHRGGLADHVNEAGFVSRVREVVARPGGDPDFYFKPDELVSFILKKKPAFAPGQGYRYTDTGYILLGMILERAGGASYYEQLQARLLRPLELTRTVPADRRDLPELACGHLAANNPLALPVTTLIDGQLRFNPANEWTGGGLVSNPQDLARWAKLLYEGKAMPFDYLDELLATSPQDSDKPTRYGLGVFVTDNSKLGRSYGHGGFFPGYLTRMAYYPKQRVAIALQFNTDHPKAGALDMLTELTGEVLAVCGVSP